MTLLARTIREQVTELIRKDLIAGCLSPGQPLREQELAERFGVSRGPVRDAFLQLTQEGFLAYEANCGVTVRTAMVGTERDFLMSLRWQTEEFVIRRGFSQITPDDLHQLEGGLDRLRVACAQKDVAAIAQYDMEFHQAILLAAGGEEFLPIWKQLCTQMLLAYTRFNNFSQIVKEHEAIVEALRQKKLKAALAAVKENLK